MLNIQHDPRLFFKKKILFILDSLKLEVKLTYKRKYVVTIINHTSVVLSDYWLFIPF